jgi:hypothetical protein
MTIPRWGRVTPSQMFMLMLAGHVLRPRHAAGAADADEERRESMRAGRERLRELTGQDLGYDLERWHELLVGNEQWGYRHPYGWDSVRPAVLEAVGDPDRLRLVRTLEAGG